LANGEELFYTELNPEWLGKKPSLLFVHGNTSGSYVWHSTMEALKDLKRHIIALDQRGFAKSTYKNKCNRLEQWA
jgi:pimeloyl-ACP methyl ester carboxylesterase